MASFIFNLLRAMDAFILVYFIYFFQVRLLGIIVALLFGYRLMKSFFPPAKKGFVYRIVDCSNWHSPSDRHRHVGAKPSGHVHSEDKPHAETHDLLGQKKG